MLDEPSNNINTLGILAFSPFCAWAIGEKKKEKRKKMDKNMRMNQ